MRSPGFCAWCGRPLVQEARGGRDRLLCKAASCDYVFWDNPTPVVAALVENAGQVVLIQNKGWPTSWYGLVTGFLERDETPEEGTLREVKEELGLEGAIAGLIGAYGFSRMNQVIVAYHVIADGPIELGDELESFKLVSPDKLRPWPFATGEAVRDWLAKRRPA